MSGKMDLDRRIWGLRDYDHRLCRLHNRRLYLIRTTACKENSYGFSGCWKQGLRGAHEFSVDPTDSLHPNLRRFLNQEGKSETRRSEKTGGEKRESCPAGFLLS